MRTFSPKSYPAIIKPYLRRREFITLYEGEPDNMVPIDCLYATMVAMIRLHDPFQDADNQRTSNPFNHL